MKKILGIVFLIFFNISTPANANLDIGEGSKVLDMNLVCTNTLDISDQKWFGIKFMEEGKPLVTLFNLDKGEYGLPDSTLINYGETAEGWSVYGFHYGIFDDNPSIWENMLFTKSNKTELDYFRHELDKKDVPKIINETKTKMRKEPDNTKFIKLLDQLTYEIDKILGTKPASLKKKLSFKYNCKDSTPILKAS